jgi:hypothetical protein
MNKLSSKFYRSVAGGVMQGEDSAANAVSGFEECHFLPGTRQSRRRRNSGCARTNYDHLCILRHSKKAVANFDNGLHSV